MAETGHWSVTPRNACQAILTGLTALEFVNGGAGGGGSGCVKSISRIAHDTNLEQIRLGLHKGLPGILLFYGSGSCKPTTTGNCTYEHEMRFRLLCLSDNFESRIKRQSGEGDMDSDAAIMPGIEELQDWGLRLALRALRDTTGVYKPHLSRIDPAQYVENGLYIGAVDITAMREIDIHDDAAATTLLELGLVHSPRDYDDLWLDSPTDSLPDSTLPRPIDGDGPFDL